MGTGRGLGTDRIKNVPLLLPNDKVSFSRIYFLLSYTHVTVRMSRYSGTVRGETLNS